MLETTLGESGDRGKETQALTTSGVLTDGLLEVEGHLWRNAAAETNTVAPLP